MRLNTLSLLRLYFLFYLLLFFLSVTLNLGVWYDDRSMYLVVHKGLKVCTGATLLLCVILRGLNSLGSTIESYGDLVSSGKDIFDQIVMKIHRNDNWDVYI